MTDIKLRIEVNSDAETEMLGKMALLDDSKVCNTGLKTTNKVYSEMPSSQFKGVEGLSFGRGYLVFNKDGFLANEDTQSGTLQSEQEPVEFIWGAADENGYYDLTLKLTNCKNLDKIVVYGDSVSNQFPIEGYLDNETEPIESDDGKWAIQFKNPASTHTIRFTRWNRPNYNAAITLIKVMLRYLDIDKFNGLKYVESLSQSTGQPRTLYYGIVPNSGTMEIVDVNGELSDLIVDGIIPNSNLKIELFANDKLVQNHITTDSDYNTTTRVFSGELSDELSQWNKLQYSGYTYDNNPHTAYELLEHVLTSMGYSLTDIDEMLGENIVFGPENEVGTIKAYLQRITIKYAFLMADTIRNTIEKFCRLAQLQVYKNDEGKIKFVSARPIASTEEIENALSIPKRMQTKPFTKAIVLKNKYEAVELLEKKVNDIVDYNVILANFKTTEVTNATSSSNSATDSFYNSVNKTNYELKVSLAVYYTNISYTFNANSLDNFEQVLNVIEESSKYYLTFDDDSSGTISTFSFSYTYNPSDSNAGGPYTASTSVSNESTIGKRGTISFNSSTNEYTVNFSVPTKIERRATFLGSLVSTFPVTVYSSVQTAKQVEISIYGNKRVISFKDNAVSDENVTKVNTFASLDNSELLQDGTMFDDIKMSELLKSNIKNDYKKGISTANLTIACVDVFDKNNNRVKLWENGEMVETHNLLNIEGDRGTWRVTGRKFHKSGVPLVDLEVQEIHNKI